MEDAKTLYETITQHKSYAIQKRLDELTSSYYIFDVNYQELRNFFVYLESPESFTILWDYYQQDKHQIAIRELQRLIHNFLASVKSLIDHTRNVVKDLYRNTKFYEEYALKVNSIFVDNRLAVFTQDLRNYFTHHSLPTVTPWVHLGTGSPAKPSYTLSRNELLNHYSGWTRKSKEFLQNSNDDLLLSSILDDYHALAEGFRVWFVERLKKIHALEFSHLESLQNRFHTLISKSFEESDKEIDKYGENVLGLVTPISAIRDSNK